MRNDMTGMEQLIEDLKVFSKYSKSDYPTHCEHDTMMIADVAQDDISEEDLEKVSDRWLWSEEDDGYISYRFGKA
jgi:hypothetical protein